jgi:hypothetical protein
LWRRRWPSWTARKDDLTRRFSPHRRDLLTDLD